MKAEYIQHMGSDLIVVNAARVSFDKESKWHHWDGTGKHFLTKRDEKLIKYLATHNHFTPFTHCSVTMRETVPIFVARQRFKHMVGFSYNEVSRRYVDDAPTFFEPVAWRAKADNKKQGSGEDLSESRFHTARLRALHAYCANLYQELLRDGVCAEQARMVLPQSMYTSYYVTGSLAAWARAYKLRIHPHAQKEIQRKRQKSYR